MMKLRRQKKNRDDLTRHIELVHPNKTVLYSLNPLFYNVVSKVNYITKKLTPTN